MTNNVLSAQAMGLDSKDLPPGRFRVSLDDVKTVYVECVDFEQSTTRSGIWSEFEAALGVINRFVQPQSVWLSGSFISSKLNPSDIDCLFVIDMEAYDQASEEARATLNQIFGSQLLQSHGYRVDCYMLPWVSVPEPALVTDGGKAYYHWRGHWDDFWQRQRSGPKSAPITPSDAIARRGYLEVMLND